MSQITIIPQHGIVCVDSTRIDGIFLPPSEPEILTIRFNTVTREGLIEYCSSPETGISPPPVKINNLDPWNKEVEEAQEILFCRKNPKTYYSTVAPVGAPIEVTAKGWPQPANSTEVAPSAQPSPNTSLYWDGTEFVWSVFPIGLNLADAQNYVTRLVNDKAYTLLQPSDWYIVRQSETGKAIPEEWNEWRSSVRDAAKAKRTAVPEKEDLTSLEAYCESSEFQTWPTEPN
jgi:hypothetical protein